MPSFTFTVPSHRGCKHQKKPFCKVCLDAGKSEKEYTGHWLKDRSGKVICPTLLATECRYCHEHGHFKSHCPALEQRKNQPRRTSKPSKTNSGWITPSRSNKPVYRKQVVSQQSAQGQFFVFEDEEQPITGGPSFAVEPQVLQGCWAQKQPAKLPAPIRKAVIQPNKIAPPVPPRPKAVIQPTKIACKDPIRKAVIQAELIELQAELAAECATNSGAWADAADIENLEISIEKLETELENLL